jgi:hypothetical protein
MMTSNPVTTAVTTMTVSMRVRLQRIARTVY